jgi:hypothetical protein
MKSVSDLTSWLGSSKSTSIGDVQPALVPFTPNPVCPIKNYLKAFELGRPLLKKEPEDFFLLATATEAGYDNALAGNASLNAETIDYARRANQMIEGGKVTRADPFNNLEMARGFLNSSLGWFLKDLSPGRSGRRFSESRTVRQSFSK